MHGWNQESSEQGRPALNSVEHTHTFMQPIHSNTAHDSCRNYCPLHTGCLSVLNPTQCLSAAEYVYLKNSLGKQSRDLQ